MAITIWQTENGLLLETQQTLTTPDTNHPHTLRVAPVDNAKRWKNKLSQERLIEFRHDPANLRMLAQCLHPLEDGFEQTRSDVANTLVEVPLSDAFEI